MKIKLMAITLLIAALLVGCNGENKNEETSAQESETLKIKEMVQGLSDGTVKALKASITSQQLTVSNSEGENVYDLPEDEFFVSVAPYINETHP